MRQAMSEAMAQGRSERQTRRGVEAGPGPAATANSERLLKQLEFSAPGSAVLYLQRPVASGGAAAGGSASSSSEAVSRMLVFRLRSGGGAAGACETGGAGGARHGQGQPGGGRTFWARVAPGAIARVARGFF